MITPLKREITNYTAWMFLILLWGCSGAIEQQAVYTVKRGDFYSTIAVSGELEAVHATTISAPMIPWDLGSLKITRLVEDGAEVDSGDVLVEFDKSEVQKAIDDAKSELEIAQAEYRKTEINQQAQMNDLQADLEKSELQLQIARLNFELAGYKPQIEQKRIELQLQNAAIALKDAARKIENQKTINRQELSKLKLKIDQASNKLEDARETLNRMVIRAKAPGITILRRNWSTGDKIQVDEQIWRGQDIIRLPDLKNMRSRVEVNEVDIAKIDTAQEVRITLDAYPDTAFQGRISSIAALAHEKKRGSGIKVFDVVVDIQGSHEKLIPGMTVRCEITTDRIADTLFVPLETIREDETGTYVFLAGGSPPEMRAVETGEQNDNYILILNGLKEGERILLNPPALQTEAEGE